jgi:hypothetical protein
MQLFDALAKWDFEQFAATAFRKHRTGSRLAGSPVALEHLISFTTVPLKKPLLQAVPRELKRAGAQMFDMLLQYTNVKPCTHPGSVLLHILSALREHRILIDEFFCQLVKQTINNRNPTFLFRTWELFLFIASIFPISSTHYKWVLAQIARSTTDGDARVGSISAFVFIRFETRFLLQTPVDYTHDKHWLDNIPMHITRGTACFGVLLYEIMWCQKFRYSILPIPYVLYYLIDILKQRDAVNTVGLFRTPAREEIVKEMLTIVNGDMTVLDKGDVHVTAHLLVEWIRQLPNPMVPIQLLDMLLTMAAANKFLGFLDKMPQVHRFTLTYIVGFLQAVAANAEVNRMTSPELARIFGPVVVNSARSIKEAPEIERVDAVGVAFIMKLIDSCDPSLVWPLDKDYLDQTPQKS